MNILSRAACAPALAACLAAACWSNAGAADRMPSVVYAFQSMEDGASPYIEFLDAQGNAYGITQIGGDTALCGLGCGTVFKLAPDGTKTTLHIFTGPDGAAPMGIVMDRRGEIFGTTNGGGRHGFGTVFKLWPDGREKVLYSFRTFRGNRVAPHGIWPMSPPTLGRDGALYGTTQHGGFKAPACGEGGCGTVYKITTTGVLTTLYTFKGPGDGCMATSGLTLDKAGNLYGTTEGCGGGNYGTVYKIDPAGNETVLHTFTEGADGNDPWAPPVMDKAGNLYGGTTFGGAGCNGNVGCGIVYKIAPDGAYSIVHTITSDLQGLSIVGTLHVDDDGAIFGTTFEGGKTVCDPPAGCGTLFKIAPDGVYTVLYKFGIQAGDGAFPIYGLIPSPSQEFLYGTTRNGGLCCGMVFSIRK